ncbi:hypothetical protein BC567DRAFT_223046 [Phyllosticta citribraziliensis]
MHNYTQLASMPAGSYVRSTRARPSATGSTTTSWRFLSAACVPRFLSVLPPPISGRHARLSVPLSLGAFTTHSFGPFFLASPELRRRSCLVDQSHSAAPEWRYDSETQAIDGRARVMILVARGDGESWALCFLDFGVETTVSLRSWSSICSL